MAVPETLSDFVEMLRTQVNGANVTNWQLLEAKAEGFIEMIRRYVRQPAPDIERALGHAFVMTKQLAQEIGNAGLLAAKGNTSIENARSLALNAIDDLSSRLELARPSDEAGALGIGW